MQHNYIYTLTDPISNEVRYIGKSVKALKYRLSQHLKDKSGVKRSNWIQGLIKKGLVPIIDELDSCERKEDLGNLEIYWISQFRVWGFKLLNMTDGGDSSTGYKHTEETKKKISKVHKGKRVGNKNSFYGKTHSIESRKLISEANKGNTWDEERKKKHSEKLKGGKHSIERVNKRVVSCSKQVQRYDLEGNLEKTYARIKNVVLDGYTYEKVITACTKGTKYRNKIWKRLIKTAKSST